MSQAREVKIQLESVHVNRTSWTKLCLSQIESPTWIRLDVGLSVTVPEKLICVNL